jgi:hypothetical protein
MLELLAPCSLVSEELTRERGVLDFMSDRFLTTGSSLPLAEIPAEEALVASASLDGAPGLSVPAEGFLVLNLLENSPSFFRVF